MHKLLKNLVVVSLLSGANVALGAGEHAGGHDHAAMGTPAPMGNAAMGSTPPMDHSSMGGAAVMDHSSMGDAAPMDHSAMGHEAMAAAPKMFLEKKAIDGYSVSFHVMAATDGMNHGGSHNLMLKVEKGGSVISDLKINSKVVFPDGSNQSKPPMKMGGWFTAGYDLDMPGDYQLMVLFKTADGKKHFGGLNYKVE